MTAIANECTAIEERCQAAVDRLLATRCWQLLEREEFAKRVLEHLSSGLTTDPRHAATYAYSHALHTACSGIEGQERQATAYNELFQYLYDIARHHYPAVCDAAPQAALEQIYTAFSQCHEPGTFLAFACLHLKDTAKASQ